MFWKQLIMFNNNKNGHLFYSENGWCHLSERNGYYKFLGTLLRIRFYHFKPIFCTILRNTFHLFFVSTQNCNYSLDHEVHWNVYICSGKYSALPEEALVVNALAMILTAGAVVMAYILLKDDFKYRGHILITAQAD